MNLSFHKSLSELYAELLIRNRELHLKKASGRMLCIHCSQQESVHLSDGRCSCSAVSREFRSTEQIEMDKVDKALTHIEALKEMLP